MKDIIAYALLLLAAFTAVVGAILVPGVDCVSTRAVGVILLILAVTIIILAIICLKTKS